MVSFHLFPQVAGDLHDVILALGVIGEFIKPLLPVVSFLYKDVELVNGIEKGGLLL